MRKLTAFLTAAAMLCSPICAHALSTEQAEGYGRGMIAYEKQLNGIKPNDSLLTGEIAANAGSESSDWLAIGAVRFGLEEDTSEYLDAWTKNLGDMDISRAKTTDISRGVLTALCIGADVSAVGLPDSIYMRDGNDIGRQGLNGWVWALIAIDSCDLKDPENAATTRLDMVSAILSAQNEDGGFSIEPSADSDPDLTAMAVQALSPYRGCGEVAEVIARAADFLAAGQESFDSCETAAQTVCALCCIGIDPDEDERFSHLTATLISYANDDGGFAHEKGGESSEMASAQALIALCSLSRLRNGERSVYDMNDGALQTPTAGSLEEVVKAKGRNATPPSADSAPISAKHSDSRRGVILIPVTFAALAAAGAIIGSRKRKGRTK